MENFKISRTKRAAFGGANSLPSLDPIVFTLPGGEEKDLKIVLKQGSHERCSIENELGDTKKLLDDIPPAKYRAIRDNNNPYEQIKFFFQNRAAFKMVELDYHFKLVPNAGKSFVVADICSGPGGFSEYILTKLKWKAQVFGFTLRNRDDFRVDNFNVSSVTESFHAYYGPHKENTFHETPKGVMRENRLGNGDITSLENLEALEKRINKKVDLVTADGGFEISDYNNQEVFARKMLLGEFITPLMILKQGGDFVCKLFTTFTEFSYDLLFLASCLFNTVYFTKPISSRVANSERFLVCKDFRGINESLLSELKNILNSKEEIPEGSTQATLPQVSFLDHSSYAWKVFKKSLDDINEKVTQTQISHLQKIIETASLKYDKVKAQKNSDMQVEIAKRVSSIVKIHQDPSKHSPDGYLWYSPMYGQSLSDPVDAISKVELFGKKGGLYLVKTGYGKRPRAKNIYFIQDGKVTVPYGKVEGWLERKLPFDTIAMVELNETTDVLELKDIIFSYLPPGYDPHDYKLLKMNVEL